MSKSILEFGNFKKTTATLFLALLSLATNAAINIITPLPTNLTKCEGDSLLLNVSLTSDHPVDFTWRRNGNVIGNNSSSLVLPVLSLTDTGTYTCEIKEQVSGATNIQSCHIAINAKPLIVSHITGTNSPMCMGSDLNLSVNIQNATLVWRRNGTVLSTGTSMYSKMGVTHADTGTYTVLAKAMIGCKDTISNPYPIEIRTRAYIIDTPKGAKLRDGAQMSHVMRIKVGGDGPFAYQWYKDGMALPGKNDDSLKIFSFTSAADSGAYRVIVNTTLPCLDTLRSKLLLVEPTLCPILLRQTDTLLNACMGGPAVLEVSALGVHRYQWYKVNNNGTQDSLEGGIYNRFIIATSDSTTAGFYNLIMSKDPSITGDCQEKDLFKRVKVVVNPRQKVTVQPMPNASCSATSHTLSVRGQNATMYQWYKNGVVIAGATDSNYTVNPVTTSPDEYKAHVRNPYCTDEPSNTVTVRQVNPSTSVKLAVNDRLNLMEQCTDNQGWTYYAHESNRQEMLLAIKKNGNTAKFSPDIRFTGGFIKELEPTTFDKKVVLMGLRMFSIKLDTGSIVNPYSVRFFYNEGPSEKGTFMSTIQARKNALTATNEFSTDLPTDDLSFVVSTERLMTKDLILAESKSPISFPHQIVNDKAMGRLNSIAYVDINNLVTSQGGGTFYFHYQRKAGSNINNSNNDQIEIYPIPSNGLFTIKLAQNNRNNTNVIMTDMIGRIVKTLEIGKMEISKDVNCSDLPAGNYMLTIDNGSEISNNKIVISK